MTRASIAELHGDGATYTTSTIAVFLARWVPGKQPKFRRDARGPAYFGWLRQSPCFGSQHRFHGEAVQL